MLKSVLGLANTHNLHNADSRDRVRDSIHYIFALLSIKILKSMNCDRTRSSTRTPLRSAGELRVRLTRTRIHCTNWVLLMSKREYKKIEDYPEDWEPDWLDPGNDRKTPYTEEELKEFAQGFMSSMSDTAAVKALVEKAGKENAEKIVKNQLKKKDNYNLDNLQTDYTKH